jgi:DNA-binding NtrC family response regulator
MNPSLILIADLRENHSTTASSPWLTLLEPCGNCVPVSDYTSQIAPDLMVAAVDSIVHLQGFLDDARFRWPRVPCLALLCNFGCDRSHYGGPDFLAGLDDFLCWPAHEFELFARVKRLLPQGHECASAEARALKARFRMDAIVGESEALLRVLRKIPSMSKSDAPVLISGETGTGKELFARAIHDISDRGQKPFIAVNCGALPDHLFENELFGHAKGAYTDASSSESGLVAAAHRGTLFLDELGTLSFSAQAKLLRFLQDHEYRPLGSSKAVKADVRILAATNADLARNVAAQTFRADLYHRLNVLRLQIPPLRQRVDDIPILARHFLQIFAAQHKRGPMHFSAQAIKKLAGYSWPGNIRELESVIHATTVLTVSNTIQPYDIDTPGGEADAGGSPLAKAEAMKQFEHSYLSDLLAAHSGNISHAAKTSGKDRRTLQRLVKKHGIRPAAFRAAV